MDLLKSPTFSQQTHPLACFFQLLLLLTTLIPSFSARTLGGIQPPPPRGHHHKTMTFYMPNMLISYSSSPHNLPTTQPKPLLGLFPPLGGGGVVSASNSVSSQSSFGLHGIGTGTGGISSYFSTAASSSTSGAELELGKVNTIDVDLLEKTNLYGLTLLGKAKGMYVGSLENDDGSSQLMMMAMTVSFVDNEFKDGLRLFGQVILHADQPAADQESHVSIIGGSGKYEGANGYATIKAVKLINTSKIVKKKKKQGAVEESTSDVYLLVDVYLG